MMKCTYLKKENAMTEKGDCKLLYSPLHRICNIMTVLKIWTRYLKETGLNVCNPYMDDTLTDCRTSVSNSTIFKIIQ